MPSIQRRITITLIAALVATVSYVPGCGPDPTEPFAVATWSGDHGPMTSQRLIECADGSVLYVRREVGDHVFEVRAGDWPVAVRPLCPVALSFVDAVIEDAAASGISSELQVDDVWARVCLGWRMLSTSDASGGGIDVDAFRAMLHYLDIPGDRVFIATARVHGCSRDVSYVAVRVGADWLYLDPAACRDGSQLDPRLEHAQSVRHTDDAVDYRHPWRVEFTRNTTWLHAVPRLSETVSRSP